MTSRRAIRLVYSVTESAELLGISRSTAYELVARGQLPTVRIGRRRMVTRPTLTELLGVEPPMPADLDDLRHPQPPTTRDGPNPLSSTDRQITATEYPTLPIRAS